MKKFLGLIVLLVALAVCAAALVACNPSSGDQATPQSIQFEDKDGADRSTFWDLGIFDYGTAYADILPSFTLNLYYSDGSTKELAAGDYTVSYIKIEEEDVPLQSIPAVPDAGYYQIVFDKDELQARMLFTVESVMRTDLTLSLPRNEWEYDEANPTPTVGGYSATDGNEPLFYCVGKAAFDDLPDEQKAEYWLHVAPAHNMGEVPCTIAVGEYYAYAKIPESGNYTDSYTAITPETAFTVKKAVLHYDSAVSSNLQAVFNYHSGIQGGINLGDINITTRDFSVTALKDKTGAEILGQYVWDSSVFIDSDDNGKTFDAIYQLDPKCEASYTVENGSIPVEVTINKGSVSMPSLGIPDNKLHAANEGFGPYPDNALPYVVVNDIGGYSVHIYNGWDKNTMQVSVAVGDGGPTNALVVKHSDNDYCVVRAFSDPGKYTVTLSLRDKTNFVWWEGDETTGTDDIVLTFEVKEKKAVHVPTAHLRDSATGTDGVDFVTLDGNAHFIDFTDFTDGAIKPEFNGEYSYPVVGTAETYYLLEADKLETLVDTAVGYGTITITLAPDDEYTWEDDSAEPVEYTCKINGGSTFFPGIKVASAYTAFDPENPSADDAEVMQLMGEWLGVGDAGKMETDYRDYNAAVYFYASQDDNKAKYVGTVTNSHTSLDNFGTYSMSFDLADIEDKSAPAYYGGTAKIEAGSKVVSTIYPNDDPFNTDFFLIAKVDCREAVQSENITYAYATFGDCTVIRMEGTSENSAEGTSTSSEVYMIFRGGEYVGHEINTTVTADGVSTDFFVQFALAR